MTASSSETPPPPPQDLRGHVVLITGGSSGIGLGLAIAAIERGARVGLIGTNSAKLAAAEAEVLRRGGHAASAVLDVADATAWPQVIDRLSAQIGAPDSLILNAGVGTENTPADTAPDSLWRWTFGVNVLGVTNGLRTCVPEMRRRNRPGFIMITASIAALVALPGLSPYSVSKAGAVALAEALRVELNGSCIRPSVLIPAAVRTDFSATCNRHAPAEWDEHDRTAALARVKSVTDSGLDPLDVGRYAIAAMMRGDFYIFTHPDFREHIERRNAEMLAAIPAHAPLRLP